jgi:lipopolysaccharide transport system permease protein
MAVKTHPIPSLRTKLHPSVTLLSALVYRDVTARYRRSMLGPLWALLQPLILMVVFNLLRRVADIPSEGLPYIVFSYAGLVPWTFFSNAVTYCGPSIARNANIIKKIALTREIFPLSAVIVALFDFVMSGLVLAGMMVFYRVRVGWSLLWLPLLCLNAGALAFAVGLVIAALGAFKRDFILATPFLMQIWLFATPVIYPLSAVPKHLQVIYWLNPMAGIIEGFRSIILNAEPPALGPLGWSGLITLTTLAVTWAVFHRLSRYFADVL